jgi:hypothetical protein
LRQQVVPKRWLPSTQSHNPEKHNLNLHRRENFSSFAFKLLDPYNIFICSTYVFTLLKLRLSSRSYKHSFSDLAGVMRYEYGRLTKGTYGVVQAELSASCLGTGGNKRITSGALIKGEL